nr:tRNA (adenosine(37)-N6)-threonylcarbamoyltransferase complex transferase subunit TsaD [Kiritimatiellia bacterium]
MILLGIESSCDETAAAVVRDGREVLSSVVHSQIASHRPYGGVVPEIASREHVGAFPVVAAEAVAQAGIEWADLDAIAVTHGPGLVSSLLIGLSGARALGQVLG